MEDWRIVTAHTPSYAHHYERLVGSLGSLAGKLVTYPYPEGQDWRHASGMKPTHVLRALKEYPSCSMLWLDADAELVGFPGDLEMLSEPHGDLGLPTVILPSDLRMGNLAMRFYVTGTMFVRNTGPGREVMRLWAEASRPPMRQTSQRIFQAHLPEWLAKAGAELFTLPPEFAEIAGGGWERFDRPVIHHHQASRKMRKVLRAKRRGIAV